MTEECPACLQAECHHREECRQAVLTVKEVPAECRHKEECPRKEDREEPLRQCLKAECHHKAGCRLREDREDLAGCHRKADKEDLAE